MQPTKPIPIELFTEEDVSRFWTHVTKLSSGCWPYTGAVHFVWRGQFFQPSRVAFALQKSQPDPELKICHTCDFHPCCNGEHLFQGTQQDNIRDMHTKGRGGTFKLSHVLADDLRREFVGLIPDPSIRGAKMKAYRTLAAKHHLSFNHVSRVIRGEYW